MFKSVFAKYMSAFIIIIVVGFVILSLFVSSTVQNATKEINLETVYNTTEDLKFLIESGGEAYEGGFDEYVLDSSSTLFGYFDKLKNSERGLVIFLTNKKGKITISNSSLLNGEIDSSVLDQIYKDGEYKTFGKIPSVIEQDNYIRALKLEIRGENVGTIFVCVNDNSIANLSGVMIQSIMLTSVLILIACIAALFVITRRITVPLRAMSTAAKKFAEGKFDVRIPVIGNDEVAELAKAFNNMADSLANIEENRRSFLANVSHDLRTPMFNISGFIESILSGAIPPEEHKKYLKIIEQEIRRLSRLVASILDISRIQAGDRQFIKRPFDICEMARQILISFEQEIEKKNLQVQFSSDEDKLYVLADSDAIYQILYNICDNGVKFAKENGAYCISLKKKDGRILVSVYNEGDGIPEEDLSKVFDRFYKIDKSRGLDRTGAGLGLFIAKTIVEAHDEKIWVESEYGKYCMFTFTIIQSTEQLFKEYIEESKAKSKLSIKSN